MPSKRKPDLDGTRSRKRKGKEKAKDVALNIPADFFENEEYDDFQDVIGVRRPPPALSREQDDIQEATRLSLQTRPAAESSEYSSSAVVHLTPRITRSNVVANLEEDDNFQETIALRTRTARTTPSIALPVQASYWPKLVSPAVQQSSNNINKILTHDLYK